MRVIVAKINPEGKTKREIRRILGDSGLKIHDLTTANVARTTKIIRV